MTCVFCVGKTTVDNICLKCQDLINNTKEYSKLNTSLCGCPICHKKTSNKYLQLHGLCSVCYKLKGGKPNAPASPTGKEIMKFLNNKIDIYEKVEQPKRFILQDITYMYFNIMGDTNEKSMTKKLEILNLSIDMYLVDAIEELTKPDDRT